MILKPYKLLKYDNNVIYTKDNEKVLKNPILNVAKFVMSTLRWTKHFLVAFIANHIIYYLSPINLTYAWSFGSASGICLIIQILSGIFLAMHYTPHIDLAFSSVERIMRDVHHGWFIRYVHANGASMFFLVVYCHICRGLYYESYMAPRQLLWASGVIIFLLMMATAIPVIGEPIVRWLWGGYTITNTTLNRFFSLHFFLPFVIVGLTVIHLALLHRDGSNDPLGVDTGVDKVPFYPYFFVKDLFAFFCLLFVFGGLVYYSPNALGHPVNYIPADSIHIPAHIVPEWYFLPFYAILRSILHKVGNVLAILFTNQNKLKKDIFKYKFNLFLIALVIFLIYFELYVPLIYAVTTIFYYQFLAQLFPVWDEKKLEVEHQKIEDTTYDGMKLSYFHIFIILVIILSSMMFNIIFAKLYIAYFFLGVIFRVSGFQISKLFPSAIKRYKQFQKDLITLKYHWYADFPNCRDMVYISLISLGISILLAVIVPLVINISEEVLIKNYNIWCVALLLHCLFTFSIDSYIIIFANVPVVEKIGLICQKCFTIGCTVMYTNYQLTDNGVTKPNPIFNVTRDCLHLPRAVDNDQLKQFRLMQKFFPHMPIENYTYTTPTVLNSSSLDTPVILKIARENEDFLRQHCTVDELRTFRLNRPGRARDFD